MLGSSYCYSKNISRKRKLNEQNYYAYKGAGYKFSAKIIKQAIADMNRFRIGE